MAKPWMFLSVLGGFVILLMCKLGVVLPSSIGSIAYFIVQIPQFIAYLIYVLALSLDHIVHLLEIICNYPAETVMTLAFLFAYSFQIDWYPVNAIRNAIVRNTWEAVLEKIRELQRWPHWNDEPLGQQQPAVEIRRPVEIQRPVNLQHEALVLERLVESKPKSPTRPLCQNLNNSKENLCVVCITREKSVVLLPCRHLCMCSCCYIKVMTTVSKACPVCRAYVKSNIVVYT